MRFAAFLVALLSPLATLADGARTIDHARILLGDVVAKAPDGLADIDLGPSPPPGGSRVLTRDEVADKLRVYGVDVRAVTIPERTRIVAAARRLSIPELGELARPAIEKTLPPGVSLVDVAATYEVIVPPCAEATDVKLARPPRRKGAFRTVATLELGCGASVVARVPLPVVLDVSEAAATPDVRRGARVDLVLSNGAVRVSTPGSLQMDANVGEDARATVLATGKIVRVRISSPTEAEVTETP